MQKTTIYSCQFLLKKPFDLVQTKHQLSDRFFPTAFQQIIFGLTEEETIESDFFSLPASVFSFCENCYGQESSFKEQRVALLFQGNPHLFGY